jgi:hypothetical protein
VPPGRYNLQRAVAEPVAVPAGYRQVTCGPAWCLASADSHTALVRPDGSDARPVRVAGTRPVTGQVALLDRYVPLLGPAAAGQRLVFYDLTARRSAVVAPAVGEARTDGRYLWWSVGDREALTWYGLDLQALR